MTAGPDARSAAGPSSGSAGAAVERLIAVLARLRAEDGCPWDRKPTWSSLRRFVLEEAHELAAAIDDGDPALVREECGDLLLQVAFLSGIAAETGEFGLTEVAEGITAKLVRRHPQVFGDGPRAADAAEALATWEAVKAEEKRERDGSRAARPPARAPTLPPTLPALVAATKVADRRRSREAAETGSEEGVEATLAALREASAGRGRSPDGATGGATGGTTGGTAGEATGETADEATDEATDGAGGRELAVAVGEALYAVAETAAAAGVDPEAALSAAVRRRLDPARDGPTPEG